MLCRAVFGPLSPRSYTAQNCCFFEVGKATFFLTRPNFCCPTSLSKLNILSDFDPKTIRANQLALEQNNMNT